MSSVVLRLKVNIKALRLSKKDVILNLSAEALAQAGLFQNLHSLFKIGDTGSGSGMTQLSLLAYLTSFLDNPMSLDEDQNHPNDF